MRILHFTLVLLTALALGSVLAGCGSSAPPSAAPADLDDLDPTGQLITYWYHYSGDAEQALLSLIDAFNSANEWGIVVQGVYAGTPAEIQNKLSAGIQTGKLPDLADSLPEQVATYTQGDSLVDLAPYGESQRWGFTSQDLEDLVPFFFQSGDRTAFNSVPFNCSIQVLYYNVDWLNELGYDHPPRTWTEFRDVSCAASSPDAGTYGYELAADVFPAMLLNRGGSVFDDDASTYAFNDAAGLETLAFLRGLLDDGCATAETIRRGAEADFGAGAVLFAVDSSDRFARYRSAVAEKGGFVWSVAPLPTTLEAPRMPVSCDQVSVFRTTPERQLASWLFIEWFVRTQQQANWARASGYLPVRTSTAALLQDYFFQYPLTAKAFGFLSGDVVTPPAVPGYSVCLGVLERMVLDVANGADPAGRLAWAEAACNALLRPQ
jgi:ABC-type glycerol-3-phosphate transport system substrate-binding protein